MNVRRIRRLRIEGFGHFREQEWEIHPRLQLFTGRNEAGKSTLLAFVRGVLFGFEPRTSAQRYEPLSGGPFGGAVWMEDDAGQFVHIRRSGHDRAAGRLSVALPDGRTAGEDWLHQWLGGIDKATFRQVFAFGLDDLQQVRWLKDEALTPFLYHTLTGGGTLEPVMKSLRDRETALFRLRGKTGPIHGLLRELEELSAQYRKMGRQAQNPEQLRQRLDEVEKEVAALEQEMRALQERLEGLEQVDQLLEPYRRLHSLSETLWPSSGLPWPAEAGEPALVSAEHWQAKRVEEEARLKQLRQQLDDVATKRSEVARQLDDIRRNKRRTPWIVAAGALLGGVLAGWLWWYGNTHGLNPAVWLGVAVLLFTAVGGAYGWHTRAARRKRQQWLRTAQARLQQEEERLWQAVAASEEQVARLREAETWAAVLGPWGTESARYRQLAAWAARSDAERDAERERLEAALRERMQRYADKLEERGRLLQQWEEARKTREEKADLQWRLSQRKAELQRLARQWSVAVLARCALEEAMAVYEREHQPRTLRRASEYFAQLTAGRYRRVWAPATEATLVVEREDGERLVPSHLSRGTLEQLLLAMRLALADEFSQQVVLPLMMDDIFVNFDAERLALAVETLHALSRRRQIVFLTCHPHVETAFRATLAGDDWGHQLLDGSSS